MTKMENGEVVSKPLESYGPFYVRLMTQLWIPAVFLIVGLRKFFLGYS